MASRPARGSKIKGTVAGQLHLQHASPAGRQEVSSSPAPSSKPAPLSRLLPVQSTLWIGAIGDDPAVFTHSATGLTFRHLRREGANVRVSICRYGGPEDIRSCCYGRDNDCNGLVGAPAIFFSNICYL